MKVLHITTSVCEQSASYRLHKALLKSGMDSYMYVKNQSIYDEKVIYSLSKMNRIKGVFNRIIEGIILRLYRSKVVLPYSLGITSTIDFNLIDKLKPDIINLHWICGQFVSICDLKRLSKYKIVWTLHDSWGFTGGCHIPFECYKYKEGCANCRSQRRIQFWDISKIIFSLKKKYYNVYGFNIVTPSKWLYQCVLDSYLMQDKFINSIPNPIDVTRYKPIGREIARKILNIDNECKVILFGALNSTSDTNKGFKYLCEALKIVYHNNPHENYQVCIFGAKKNGDVANLGYKIIQIGRLNDDISLSLLYSIADVMIVPSKSENLPNTVLESMACGVPVVAFKIGGIVDIIDHKVNGYLAKPYESIDLAYGIEYILKAGNIWRKMSIEARNKIVNNFNENSVAKKYIDLYNYILRNG